MLDRLVPLFGVSGPLRSRAGRRATGPPTIDDRNPRGFAASAGAPRKLVEVSMELHPWTNKGVRLVQGRGDVIENPCHPQLSQRRLRVGGGVRSRALATAATMRLSPLIVGDGAGMTPGLGTLTAGRVSPRRCPSKVRRTSTARRWSASVRRSWGSAPGSSRGAMSSGDDSAAM